MKTLEEAKTWLRERWGKGARCPCCTQYVKVYSRKMNSGMALVLIHIYHVAKESKQEFFHVTRALAERKISAADKEYSKLKYWGLIQSSGESSATHPSTGFWRITEKGRDFVEGKIKVQSNIRIFDRRFLGLEGEYIGIVEALSKKFDYEELMMSVSSSSHDNLFGEELENPTGEFNE